MHLSLFEFLSVYKHINQTFTVVLSINVLFYPKTNILSSTVILGRVSVQTSFYQKICIKVATTQTDKNVSDINSSTKFCLRIQVVARSHTSVHVQLLKTKVSVGFIHKTKIQ